MDHNLGNLAPLEDAAWPDSAGHMLGGFAGRLNVYRVMAHNPALLVAWETLRNHVVRDSALSAQQSEIVILRVGVRRQSRYEWVHHVLRGLDAGLDPTRILATRAASPSASTAPGDSDDTVLIAAVDAIIDQGRLSPALLSDCSARFGSGAVLDMMATVGMYSTLACVLETYIVPLEAASTAAFAALAWAEPV